MKKKKIFKDFIKDCNSLKRYNNINLSIIDNISFISICIPVYNMEKYLEKNLLSIINQSFQDFEIILVNDNSIDETEKILKRLQKEFKKIKIINHEINLGVYKSRIDGVLNANGKYILFMDPDDMLLNPYLFEELYKYNLKYNLDMTEFSVYHIIEGKKNIYFPKNHFLSHYHNFKQKIIYQPELSSILFYIPNTKNYTSLICRTIWNKLTRKLILINSIRYIEKSFHNHYLITADDTPINILNFQLANNYSNINLPGYLYNIRKRSASRINDNSRHNIVISYNYLLYYTLLFKYLKDFNKNLNILYYDLKDGNKYILKFKELKAKLYISSSISFFYKIMKNKISHKFREYIKNLILKLRNKL